MLKKPMKRRVVERKLRKRGCWLDKTTSGPHDKWRCPCGSHAAAVPRHPDVSAAACRNIARDIACLEKGWLQ